MWCFIHRHVHVAVKESLPPITAALMEFLHSEPFCRLLSHLTGLDLAKNIIQYEENEEQPPRLVIDENSSIKGEMDGELTPNCQKKPSECTSKPDATSSATPHDGYAAKIRGELLAFHPGDYTLVSDQDPTMEECELDLNLHLCCDGENLFVA